MLQHGLGYTDEKTPLKDLANVEVPSCSCALLPNVLITHGLFPTSPTQPRMAVSIDLLDFYIALFERSADAILTALAGALKTFYQRRGFPVLNDKVSLIPLFMFTGRD